MWLGLPRGDECHRRGLTSSWFQSSRRNEIEVSIAGGSPRCCTVAAQRLQSKSGAHLLSCVFLQIDDFLRVGLPGLEPGTSSLSEKRSNRLSYRPEWGFAAWIIYNKEGALTSRLKTGKAGSTIGTVSKSHYASRCERSI